MVRRKPSKKTFKKMGFSNGSSEFLSQKVNGKKKKRKKRLTQEDFYL